MAKTRYQRVDGLCVSADPNEPLLALLDGPVFDEAGYQRASRINGHLECPLCGLLIPNIEEIDVWREREDGKKYGIEWSTAMAECACGAIVCEGFDEDYIFTPKEHQHAPT